MKKYLPFFAILIVACNSQYSKSEKEENKIKKDTLAKKKIYLTFDDGPTVGSSGLYDFVTERKLPVALFLVGQQYERMPTLHKRLDTMVRYSYIVTANHSYSHAYGDRYAKFYNNTSGVVDDYKKATSILPLNTNIARTAGRNIWRLPNINITDDKGPSTGPDSLHKLGYQFLGWDCTWPYDYKNFRNKRDVAGMMNRILIYFDSNFTKMPNHLILLLHDQQLSKAENFKQFKIFVDSINNSPIYQFANLKDYPALGKMEVLK